MSFHPELTFPRRHKRTVKEKVISFTESETIYSTLSKKPADLKTSDIDLSAIRVFLVDGSHRTVTSTPETTCGEILDRLLGKLGLIERRTDYALQIKYTFSESRITEDDEQISKLNVHVWDSVDRIYLCKKDIEDSPSAPLLRRKRLHIQQPVLVNEQLVSRFARAWSLGSEKQQAGETGGQKPMTNTVVFQPARIDLEEAKLNSSPKTEQRKDSTIRRRPPVSPRKSPESPSHRFTRRTKSQGDVSKERNAPTTCSKPPEIHLTVPERISAYLHNCTIPDEELLKQGKRISQMLQLTPKKEVQEIKPLRTLQAAFSRFGTLLRKGRSFSDSSSSPPPTSGKKGLGFPDSPVSRRQDTHVLELGTGSPPKKPAENVINSNGVSMSQVEDNQVYIGKNQNPSPKGSTSTVVAEPPISAVPLPEMGPSSCDTAATVNPEKPAESMEVGSSHVECDQAYTGEDQNSSLDCLKGNTVPRSNVQVVSRRRTIIEEYDIAVPFKITPREHNYLTVLIDDPPTPRPL